MPSMVIKPDTDRNDPVLDRNYKIPFKRNTYYPSNYNNDPVMRRMNGMSKHIGQNRESIASQAQTFHSHAKLIESTQKQYNDDMTRFNTNINAVKHDVMTLQTKMTALQKQVDIGCGNVTNPPNHWKDLVRNITSSQLQQSRDTHH